MTDAKGKMCKTAKRLFLTALCLYAFTLSAGSQQVVRTVSLDEAGDLAFYLPESERYSVKKLTVSGPIDGSDMAIITDMAKAGSLSVLNLASAQMKSGGGSCGTHYYEWSGSYGDYDDPTSTYVMVK